MAWSDQIPESVVSALRYVRDEGPPELELIDREEVLYVLHCCGLQDAHDWVCEHRELYFDAVRTAAPPLPPWPVQVPSRQ
jgi:hypothetical protein